MPLKGATQLSRFWKQDLQFHTGPTLNPAKPGKKIKEDVWFCGVGSGDLECKQQGIDPESDRKSEL